MRDAIPAPVIRERARALREVSREKNLAFRLRLTDRVLPALTLAEEEGMGESVVLTENYIHARIAGLKVPPNRLVDVRIVDVQPESTAASIVHQPASGPGPSATPVGRCLVEEAIFRV